MAESLNPGSLNIVGHERCRFLTSKEMLLDVERDPSELASDSGPFWCALTQTCLGPDGQLADDRGCSHGRSCYDGV